MSEAHVHVQAWLLPLATTSAVVVVAFVYLRGWLRLRSASNLVPAWRLAAFMTGLFSVWIAVGSPFTTLDHRSLTIHMVKHLLLMTVAAPLVLAAAPVLPLLGGISRRFVENKVVVGSPPAGSFRRLTHPMLYWLVGTSTVIGWHLPVAFQLAMRSHWVHDVEDGCFLLAGLLFWWPVLQPSSSVTRTPRWSLAVYLFLATLPCDVLSAFLAFCNRPVYPYYLSTTQLFSMSALQDQECAGALMWVWVTFAYLIPAVVITIQILSPPNKRLHKPAQPAWHSLAVRPPDGSEAEVL